MAEVEDHHQVVEEEVAEAEVVHLLAVEERPGLQVQMGLQLSESPEFGSLTPAL